MKILYCAANNYGAKIQLSRFLQAMNGTNHKIKVAAYKLSSPKNISIDWTLNALLNVYNPKLRHLRNDNLNIYFDQIKTFAPDLIVSDLEYFTSYLAGLTKIPIWQYSSSLISFALQKKEKYNLGLFKFYAHSLNRIPESVQQVDNLINNSDRNLVCSHFGDVEGAPKLQSNFEWVRPYHQIHKLHVPCRHFVVAGLAQNNKKIIDILKNYQDNVVFMDSTVEKYENIIVKDIDKSDEYYCNIRNCEHFICQGQSSLLADAFYNGKFSIIYPNYEDTESIINSHLSVKFSFGEIASYESDISSYKKDMLPTYNNSIKYLREKIEEA